MRYASKGLGLSCLLVAVVSGFGLAHPAARAQEPSPDDTAADAPSPDTGTATDADADTDAGTDADTDSADADTDTDTDTDIGADTDTDTDTDTATLTPTGRRSCCLRERLLPKNPKGDRIASRSIPMRGMQQGRMRREQKTTIGGYGELHLNMWKPEGRELQLEARLHRFVLFFAHRFNDRFQFYSEIELEHAFVAESGGVAIPGSFQIEQAFIDWRLLKGDERGALLASGRDPRAHGHHQPMARASDLQRRRASDRSIA